MTPRSSALRDATIGEQPGLVEELTARFGSEGFLTAVQSTKDGIPTIWIEKHRLRETLRYVKSELPRPFPMLFDLSATDERLRRHHDGLPIGSFRFIHNDRHFQ